MTEPFPKLAQDGRPIWERIAELAKKLPACPKCQHAEDGLDRADWCPLCLRRKIEDLERRLAESEASRAAMRLGYERLLDTWSVVETRKLAKEQLSMNDAGRPLLEVVEAARELCRIEAKVSCTFDDQWKCSRLTEFVAAHQKLRAKLEALR